VTALEQDATLARHARENLEAAQQSNVQVVSGPLVAGWAANGPYDVIFLDGATEVAPEALFGQLKEGGRMIAVVGRTPNGRAMLYRCASGDVTGWPAFDAAAPTLPGFAAVPSFVF
jgi:protein-L-isoaspartate(D-aspartate) O-methyltransferase